MDTLHRFRQFGIVNILSDSILVRVSGGAEKVEIVSVEGDLKHPAVEVRTDTIRSMSLDEFSRFLGERIILLSPSLSEEFKDYFWSADGSPPKKESSEGR